MFLIGIGTFAVASLASGLAPDGTILGGPRGAGDRCGADVARRAVDRHDHLRRGRANAAFKWAVGGSGAAIGVALGGLLTSGPGWQWVFFVNVPIGIVVALGVARLIAPAATTDRPRLDLAGAASVTTMFGALLIGLINAGDDGWIAPTTIVPLAGARCRRCFVLIERIVANPSCGSTGLAEAPFPGSLLMLLSAAGLLAGGFFLNTMYLQGVLGLTAFETGAAFIPVALAIVVGAQAAAHLLGRLGARAVGTIGFAIAAVGMLLLARIPVEGNVVVDVLPGFAASALGRDGVRDRHHVGLLPSRARGCRARVGPDEYCLHELGFAIGVAVISTIGSQRRRPFRFDPGVQRRVPLAGGRFESSRLGSRCGCSPRAGRRSKGARSRTRGGRRVRCRWPRALRWEGRRPPIHVWKSSPDAPCRER